MAQNDFIGFASNGSANVMSQADYAAAMEQGVGVQPGMASSALANKVWRQGANMAAALGRIIATRGYNALDNGDLDALQSSLDDAISAGTFNRMYFSQTSGNYTAPRTGFYRITLKGGGGGGAGGNSTLNGGSGGEGGTIEFYTSLTKSQTYAYIIGAGGTAGGADTNGNGGGASSITIGVTTYTVNGGDGGSRASITGQGGRGGNSFSGASNIFFIPGAPGNGGSLASARPRGPSGGGAGGGIDGNTNAAGIYGGGGHGGSVGWGAATNGGDGFILIEYAG